MKLNPFSKEISKEQFLKDWTEKKPLPMGRADFEAWSNRIISAAMVSADAESQKFALSDMILHLGPTEDHKEDAFFIKMLRKVAVNQIANAIREEIRDKVKLKIAEEEAACKAALPAPEASN